MRGLAVLALMLEACYSPQVPPCEITCGSDSPCPDGLSCGSDSYCHADGDTATCHAILMVTVAGDGLVESTPPGIECTLFDRGCSAEFAGGTAITLSATGASFAQWSGDACEGVAQPSCTFALEISMSLTATFR